MSTLRRTCRGLLLTLIFAFVVALQTQAASFVIPPDRAMVDRADAIIAGTALTSYPQLKTGGAVETVTVLSVEQVLKGSGIGETVTVVEPGGAIDGHATIIPGVPQFTAGQHVLLFLSRTREQRWAVSDLILGKFDFKADHFGRPVLVRDASLDRDPARSAAEFMKFIRRQSSGPGLPLAATQPVRVSSAISVVYDLPNYLPGSYSTNLNRNGMSYGAIWPAFPVTWYRSSQSEFGAPNGGNDAIEAAMAAWTEDCKSSVRYVYGGIDPGDHTGGLAQPDGTNTILFERDLSSYGIGPYSCATGGVLGIGGITAIRDTGINVGNDSFWLTTEADVEMNSGIANCSALFVSGDFTTAIAHQLGHTLGIRHADRMRDDADSCTSVYWWMTDCETHDAIMSSVPTPNLVGILQPWDQHAVAALYPTHCNYVLGDFNRDSRPDLIWWNSKTGDVNVWLLHGTRYMSGANLGTVADTASWTMVAVGDFAYGREFHDNPDAVYAGWSDLLWESSTVIQYGYRPLNTWLMDGTAYSFGTTQSLSEGVLKPSDSETVEASWPYGFLSRCYSNTSGLCKDGSGVGVGSVLQWFFDHDYSVSGSYGWWDVIEPRVADLDWHIEGSGDFNHDGITDIVWQNSATGDVNVWFMREEPVPSYPHRRWFFNGGTNIGNVKDPAWKIVAVGDYNGDGTADLVWQNQTTGDVNAWFIKGDGITAKYDSGWTIFTMPDPNWRIVGPK